MSLPGDWLRAPGFQNRYFLLRHGQSEANVNSLISSIFCVSVEQHGLTPLGVTQSRESATILYTLATEPTPQVDILNSPTKIQTNVTLDQETACENIVFYSSDFKRAYETAHYCKEQLKQFILTQLQQEDGRTQGKTTATTQDPESQSDSTFDSTPESTQTPSEPATGEETDSQRSTTGGDAETATETTETPHSPPTSALTHAVNHDLVLPSPYPALYTSPLLRERHFGVFEGSSPSDEVYRQVWERDAQEDVDSDHFGVESIQSVVSRTTHLILELEQIYQSKIIVLVSHGDICQILQSVFCGIDPRLHRSIPHMNNAEIREVFLVDTDDQ